MTQKESKPGSASSRIPVRLPDIPVVTLALAILLLMAATFGWYVPHLGFYWDDWAFILTQKMQGAQFFWQYHSYDRPIAAWTNVLEFPLVGTNPMTWQIFVLVLRGLSALLAGWVVRLLWPKRTREAVWVALLFAIVPVFTQQPIAVTYSQHWTCTLLYLLSLGWMILAFRDARRFWLYTFLSLAAMTLNLFTMEYFAGVDLLRPLILWFLLTEYGKQPITKTARQTLMRWSPYLLVMVAFVFWRVFFLHLPSDDPNQLRLVVQLTSDPIAGMKTLLQYVSQDTLYILFTTWEPVVPNVRALIVALVAALLTVAYLSKLTIQPGDDESGRRSWAMRAMLLGMLGVLLAPSPAWLTGKQVAVGAFSSRFAMPALFSVSLLAVGLLAFLFSNRSIRLGAFGVLVALAILFHQDNAARFVNSWEQQKSFYWQMHWRAPGIASNTPILSDGEVLNLVGFYSTTAGLNLLYQKGSDPANLDYWFFNLENKYDASQKALESKRPFSPSFRNWRFSGLVQESLVIENSADVCVRIVEAGRPENGLLSPLLQGMALATNLSRIQPDGKAVPPVDIFGIEPAHTWCYYYQKASLARQYGNWEEIIRLGDEARQLGFTALDASEWFPFIEGYARSGDVPQAVTLTRQAHAAGKQYDPLLCLLWDDISVEEGQAQVKQFLACPVK